MSDWDFVRDALKVGMCNPKRVADTGCTHCEKKLEAIKLLDAMEKREDTEGFIWIHKDVEVELQKLGQKIMEQAQTIRELSEARRLHIKALELKSAELEDYRAGASAEAFAADEARQERDAARAQLAAVVAAALPCSICHGLGVYATACSMCGDSTYEHECDDKVAPCPAPACGDLRRALADTAQAARGHDERVRAEERERCARECEAMVIGGRAWTAEQAKAAEVLFAAAASIRALGSRS